MVNLRPMSKEALFSAFAGGSMARMRYLVFAEIAKKEGFPNVAKLESA